MRIFLFMLGITVVTTLHAEEQTAAFPGMQTEWNGFSRFDFEIDGKPVMVIAPKEPALGKPWVWHGEFFGHKPVPDIALLKQGFHVVYMSVPNMLGSPQAVEHWNATYAELTSKYHLSPKVALVGLSRGGLYCYNWAIANPDQVACIYGDAPVCDFKSWPGGKGTGKSSPRDWDLVLKLWGFKDDAEAVAYNGNPVDNLEPLAKAKVPLLHVFGDADDVVPWEENTGLIADRYKALGGEIKLIRKTGVGHHPHGLEDSTPIIEFIKQHSLPVKKQNTSKTSSPADVAELMAQGLKPFVEAWSGQNNQFAVTGKLELEIDGQQQQIELRLELFGEGAYDLALSHKDYSLELRRRVNATAFALPHHKVVFLGTGDVAAEDHLHSEKLLERLVSADSELKVLPPMISIKDQNLLGQMLVWLLKPNYDESTQAFSIKETTSFTFKTQPAGVTISGENFNGQVSFGDIGTPQAATDWPGMKVVEKERAEIERQICRGVRRISEILAPGQLLKSPTQTHRTVEHGELRWIDGQRVCLLNGSPEQIGKAHGELLKPEATKCIDSVLYAFGTINTIRTGTWFRDDLLLAYQKLESHIPERHKAETAALAASLEVDNDLAQALNVFPELFHCSGFAVFNSATVDGKLYHGRVLDYMTTIGLQDCATTFIVKPERYLPFANIGYAAFIGSVSGMNAEAISLGEMGGGGEGQWDGVPMATLMRRALEECDTLQEVKDLWTNNPRTCEYYYVFADGKTNEAVGVAAYPDSVEFIMPGQSHERLGSGIPDAVVLSAGSRLELLRERVTEKHGKLDADAAMWLMSRPVAMQSNLHNVLFVPADGIFYVANASYKQPAAERPYVKLNLKELLNEK